MLSSTSFKKVSFLKPILPLVPEAQPKSEDEQKKTITMELKSQAGTKGSATYKRRFLYLMKEPLRSGLIPRGISLKSGNRMLLLSQRIEFQLSRLYSEERP